MNDLLAQVFSYLHGIWAYRWSALVVMWLVAIPGWAVVYLLPDEYTSKAVMQVDTKSMIQPLLKGLAADSEVPSEIGFIKRQLFSERNLKKIVNETDLKSQATSEVAMEKLTYELASKLNLELIDGGGSGKKKKPVSVYMISFQGRSPELVYQIVRKALNTMINTTIQAARTDTADAQEFLDEQIAEYEKRLTLAEQKVTEFTRENIGLMPGESGGYYQKMQKQQEILEDIRTNLKLEEARLAKMQKQLKGDAPIEETGAQINQIRAYREQLEKLLTQYTESHPDVQALRETIADVLAAQNSEPVYFDEKDASGLNPAYQDLKAEIGASKIEIESLKAKLAEQEIKVDTLKSSVNLVPEVEAKMARLNRDYDITKKRHLMLVERKELALLAEAVGQSGKNVHIKVMSQPYVAEEPSGPNRMALLSIVFGLALAAGIAWSIVKFALQPTFIYVRQLNDQIGLPVLGTIGLYMTPQHKRKRKMQLVSFLLVFSILLVAYGYNVYNVSGVTVNDILMSFESPEI